jgi:uncharacterized protein YndB with AHSA1/START domain
VALIDQRILIGAPPEGVWRILSDSNQLSRWHAGYRGVSVLTTQSTGVGTRRRCTLSTGKDVIEEITAWVDGWGYEYVLVEGGPYRAFQGRFRLQAGPDGTSVQWTIAYQPKGLPGTIRDRLGGQRRVQEMMTVSLRQLRRAVEELGVRIDEDYRSRVAIRERMNADERAQYQRRYQPSETADSDSPAEDQPAPEPSFVADLTDAEPEPATEAQEDTQPKPPRELRDAIAAQEAPPAPADSPAARQDVPPEHAAFAPPPEPAGPPPAEAAPEAGPVPADDDDSVPDYRRVTPPRGIPAVQPPAESIEPPPPGSSPTGESPVREEPPPEAESRPADPPADKTEPVREAAATGAPPRQDLEITLANDRARSPAPGLPPQTPQHDTGEISIWDVFGMRRPSEQDSEALDSLVQSVQTRELTNRLVYGRMPKRPVRVRRAAVALGLRLRLALASAGVRFHKRWGHGGQ